MTKSQIALMSQLASLSKVSAFAMGKSGAVAVAKELGIRELEDAANALAAAFDNFGRALTRAVAQLDSPDLPEE